MGRQGSLGNKLFRYQWNMAVVRRKWQYLIPAAVALQVCFLNRNLFWGKLSSKEYFWKFLEGSLPMQPGSLEPFRIPGDWCIFCIFLLYMTGKTAKDFTDGIGMQMLIRTDRVKYLWWAKCLACLGNVCIYFGAAYLTVGAFCVWKTGDIYSFWIGWNQIFVQFLLPVLAAGVICIWQMVVSLVSSSLLGMLVMCVLLVTSAYFEKWYLIGNYLMKIRVQEMLPEQISGAAGVLFLTVLLAGGILAGSKAIEKMDYMHTKGDL